MPFDTAAAVLDWLGVIVFTISGALVASRKQMDLIGFALLGTVTGIGGGTLRDVLLGQLPVFWGNEPAYLITCVLVSGVVFLTAHIPQSRYRLLLWFDALGLALFAVSGAERAMLVGSGPIVAVSMGERDREPFEVAPKNEFVLKNGRNSHARTWHSERRLPSPAALTIMGTWLSIVDAT